MTAGAATTGTAPAFSGPTVQLGGSGYVLPPLSFGAFKRHSKVIRQIAEGEFTDQFQLMDALTDVIYSALQRNYPALSRQVVEDALDWQVGQQLFAMVLQQSVPITQGEKTAETPSGASTGT